MADRRDLEKELNRINALYHEKDLEMRKAGATIEQRQMLRDMLNSRKKRLEEEFNGNGLKKLSRGEPVRIPGGTVTGEALDQSILPDAAKQKGLGKEHMFSKLSKQLGKKAIAALPLAGAGMAALSGDPAMAAEELATDIAGPAGMAYEALKPDVAGNPEEEKQLLTERQAMNSYKNSPAYRNRRGLEENEFEPEIPSTPIVSEERGRFLKEASENYEKSPAKKDRLLKLKALLGDSND